MRIKFTSVLQKLSKNKFKILGLISVIYVAIIFGETRQASREKKLPSCKENSDCILVYKRNSCCQFSYAISRNSLSENSDFVKYTPQDKVVWKKPDLPKCENVFCSNYNYRDIEFPQAICHESSCEVTQMMSIGTSVDTNKWKTYVDDDYKFSIKYPNYPSEWVIVEWEEDLHPPGTLKIINFYLKESPVKLMKISVLEEQVRMAPDIPLEQEKKKFWNYEFNFYSWEVVGGGERAELFHEGKYYDIEFTNILEPDLKELIASTFKFIDDPNIKQEEGCYKLGTGESMGLSEAKAIALKSECFEKGGVIADKYNCSQVLGAWYIKIDNTNDPHWEKLREHCSPSCMVELDTKEACKACVTFED